MDMDMNCGISVSAIGNIFDIVELSRRLDLDSPPLTSWTLSLTFFVFSSLCFLLTEFLVDVDFGKVLAPPRSNNTEKVLLELILILLLMQELKPIVPTKGFLITLEPFFLITSTLFKASSLAPAILQ